MQVSLAWSPHVHGVFKLNMDGSHRVASSCIGARGILRNSLGEWHRGFAVNVRKCQVLEAELQGLFFGLKFVVDKGISNLIIEMDYALAVHLIKQPSLLGFHPSIGLISSCLGILRKFESWELSHIYREKNIFADRLANWS